MKIAVGEGRKVVMYWIHTLVISLVFLLVIAVVKYEGIDVAELPSSDKTFAEADADVGCGSVHSQAKLKDIFEENYKNHWFVWSGRVISADAGSVLLDMNGGLADVSVDFENDRDGYDVTEGSMLTVRFFMSRAGGCVLPFVGENGQIVAQ